MAVTRIKNSGIKTGTVRYGNFDAGLPTAPVVGTVTVTNSTTVSVPFTGGGDGGSPITSYQVLSNPSITLTVTGTSSPLTVTGTFVSGVAYTFQVRSVNANGTSAYSAASNSVTPIPPVTVTGGDLTSDATYYYRRFTASGTLGISGGTLTFDVLRVAGGGSGGTAIRNSKAGITGNGGGGGAGGRLLSEGVSASTDRTVVIGAGAAWPSSSPAQGLQGSATTFTGLTNTTGGGGGGASNTTSDRAGQSGGSGGGGGFYSDDFGSNLVYGAGGSGTSGQGNSGATPGGSFGGGGGGSGGSGSSSSGGSGTTTWNWTTSAGGNGSTGVPQAGTSGTANTGNGGGGGSGGSASGDGGSGVVIVRYTRSQVGG